MGKTKSYQLPVCRYAEGSPVVVDDGVLQLTERKCVNLTLNVVALRTVTNVKVLIHTLNAQGVELSAPQPFSYDGISAQYGEYFGQDTPIYLSDSSAASFTVDIVSVQLDGQELWEAPEGACIDLPKAKTPLQAVGRGAGKILIDQLGYTPKVFPARIGGFVHCGCGCRNLSDSDTCIGCGKELAPQLELAEEEIYVSFQKVRDHLPVNGIAVQSVAKTGPLEKMDIRGLGRILMIILGVSELLSVLFVLAKNVSNFVLIAVPLITMIGYFLLAKNPTRNRVTFTFLMKAFVAVYSIVISVMHHATIGYVIENILAPLPALAALLFLLVGYWHVCKDNNKQKDAANGSLSLKLTMILVIVLNVVNLLLGLLLNNSIGLISIVRIIGLSAAFLIWLFIDEKKRPAGYIISLVLTLVVIIIMVVTSKGDTMSKGIAVVDYMVSFFTAAFCGCVLTEAKEEDEQIRF